MNWHKELYVDDDARLLFCTDLHGHIMALEYALKHLNFRVGKDVLVCAGDLIDRGPHNELTALKFINDKTGSFHSVRGNHDQFAIDHDEMWIPNGGGWAWKVFPTYAERKEFGEKLKALPALITVYHKGKCFGVVHASVPQEIEDWDVLVNMPEIGQARKLRQIIWDREYVQYHQSPFYQKPVIGVDYTIHGHTPVRVPLLVANRLHIDGGFASNKNLFIAEMIVGKWYIHSFSNNGVDTPEYDLVYPQTTEE